MLLKEVFFPDKMLQELWGAGFPFGFAFQVFEDELQMFPLVLGGF